MHCVDHIIEGGAGRAYRFGRHHLPHAFSDQWAIDLDESRMFFVGPAGQGVPTLRSQLTLIIAPVDVMGGLFNRPVLPDPPTHAAVLAIPHRRFDVDHLDLGLTMYLEPVPVGYFEGRMPDKAARLAGHTLAGCIAHGELPVGARVTGAAFAAAAGAAFRTAGMVTVVRVREPEPRERVGGGIPDGAAHDA